MLYSQEALRLLWTRSTPFWTLEDPQRALLCSSNHNSLTNRSKDHWHIEHSSQRTITEFSNFSSVNMKTFLFWFPKEIIYFSTRKNILQRLWIPNLSEKEKEKKSVSSWISKQHIYVFLRQPFVGSVFPEHHMHPRKHVFPLK